MSRPRFLADHDLNEHIVDGLLRREPAIEFVRARDVGMSQRPDWEVLAFAAEREFVVVSHDVNTMIGHAAARISSGEIMTGLLMVPQTRPLLPVIESLLLIWLDSEAADWRNMIRFLPL